LAFFLDDRVAVGALDDVFEVAFVARDDEEAARLGTDALVDGQLDVDPFEAALVAALAEDQQLLGRRCRLTLAEAAGLPLTSRKSASLRAARSSHRLIPGEVTTKPVAGYSRSWIISAQRERAYLSRSEEIRSSNDHIAERALKLRFVSRVPMLCECSDPDCKSIILIGLDRYDRLRTSGFFTAPDHTIEDAEPTTARERVLAAAIAHARRNTEAEPALSPATGLVDARARFAVLDFRSSGLRLSFPEETEPRTAHSGNGPQTPDRSAYAPHRRRLACGRR
jgi:hypothetical protein